MQVILTENVPNLGSLGDTVRVKPGYARNYLLPRGMAIAHSSKKSKEIDHQRKRLEQLRLTAIENARAESEKVSGMELVVIARAGANGRLFGSVTNRDVQAALAEKGYTLDRRSIQIHEQIKQVGTYTATVRLHTDVKVEVSVVVKPEFVKETQAAEGLEGGEEAAAQDGEEAQTEAEATAEGATMAASADEEASAADSNPEDESGEASNPEA